MQNAEFMSDEQLDEARQEHLSAALAHRTVFQKRRWFTSVFVACLGTVGTESLKAMPNIVPLGPAGIPLQAAQLCGIAFIGLRRIKKAHAEGQIGKFAEEFPAETAHAIIEAYKTTSNKADRIMLRGLITVYLPNYQLAIDSVDQDDQSKLSAITAYPDQETAINDFEAGLPRLLGDSLDSSPSDSELSKRWSDYKA